MLVQPACSVVEARQSVSDNSNLVCSPVHFFLLQVQRLCFVCVQTSHLSHAAHAVWHISELRPGFSCQRFANSFGVTLFSQVVCRSLCAESLAVLSVRDS